MSLEDSNNCVDVELNNKDKHVTFTSSMIDQTRRSKKSQGGWFDETTSSMIDHVPLRDKTNQTKRGKKSQGGWFDETSDQLNKVHDLWLFKIRKSSLIKATFWIGLFVAFIVYYFLDAFEAFRDEKTSFSFYKRPVENFESPTLIICTNPGFKASVLEGCGYDELGDFMFMSEDIANGTSEWVRECYLDDPR